MSRPRLFLIFIGLVLLFLPTIIKSAPSSGNEPIKIDKELLENKSSGENPERIIIPNRQIDLKVKEAKIVNGFWELSEKTASHGVGSADPGEKGNIVIFAHARNNLFGPLKEAKIGEHIYLLTKSSKHGYKVTETKLVSPNETENIAKTKTETLTLFTCSGFLDTKRLIVLAKPL